MLCSCATTVVSIVTIAHSTLGSAARDMQMWWRGGCYWELAASSWARLKVHKPQRGRHNLRQIRVLGVHGSITMFFLQEYISCRKGIATAAMSFKEPDLMKIVAVELKLLDLGLCV